MAKQYLFQKKKCYFTQRIFDKGLNASACILFTLKETGEDFLRNLPDCYPGLKIWKDIFGVSGYSKPTFTNKTVKANIQKLIKDGLINKQESGKKFSLTNKGKEMVNYIESHYAVLKKQWDGKFRIVIFDIPESLRIWREFIRDELLLLQFQQLQRSVYIGKCPIPELLYQDMEKHNLGRYVFVFTVYTIDKVDFIKQLFQ